jgi:hypothetical protein
MIARDAGDEVDKGINQKWKMGRNGRWEEMEDGKKWGRMKIG